MFVYCYGVADSTYHIMRVNYLLLKIINLITLILYNKMTYLFRHEYDDFNNKSAIFFFFRVFNLHPKV